MAEPVLPADFREFLKLLNEAAVEYRLIGGYAVGYHGYPRTTADMDVWVAMRIEVLTEIDGVVFHECFAAREVVVLDGQRVNMISLSHLRKNTLASGRHKDLDDLEHLPKRRTNVSRVRRVPRRS